MADIALVTADRVEVVKSWVQLTLPAAEAITAGMAVRLDTTNGKFTKANGTLAAEARIFGIAVKTVAAGEPLTAINKGILNGYDLSGLDYDAAVYISDTDGRLEGTTAPTIDVPVGRVVPGFATTLGTAADKLLFIDATPYFAYNPSDPDRVLVVPIVAGEASKHVFIADRAYKVKSIEEIHSVVSTAANTLTIRKLTAVAAPDAAAGANVKELLQAGFDLKSTVNTTVTGTLTATAADLALADGNMLAFAVSASTAGLGGCVVTIVLTPA